MYFYFLYSDETMLTKISSVALHDTGMITLVNYCGRKRKQNFPKIPG